MRGDRPSGGDGAWNLFDPWRIVPTMGSRITHLTPMQGFCAETGEAITLFMAKGPAAPPLGAMVFWIGSLFL